MADVIDDSQPTEELFLNLAIRAARGIRPARVDSAETCEECGCAIPQQRRDALPGVQTCLDCAVELESRRLRGLV
jgi:phage/conjugal plasmid C-4 type zinc finger TraR family protein